jgi:energy-coupling factor transport system ATP-binding protein
MVGQDRPQRRRVLFGGEGDLAIIELRNVTFKQPNGVVALDDVSLDVEKGEVLAIVGGNGAGKTTLLKQLNGLLKPSSGSVKIFGRETKEQSVAELSRKIGLVFQNSDHQLFSETAESEVLFGLRNFGFLEEDAVRRAAEVFSYFGLDSLRQRAPLTLSGGEKKRLCIAAVMAWNPEVLVLDEPTVGQDYPSKSRIFDTIKQLVAAEKTVIVVSHDLEFLWPLDARTVVMRGGKVVADGDSQTIYSDSPLLEGAGLKQPQLVTISKLFGRSPSFRNVSDAANWLSGR